MEDQQTYLKGLLENHISFVPKNKDELFKSDEAHINSIEIVDKLCEELKIYENKTDSLQQ